ncbi:MAG TPA: tRNA uridine-5-carboxymethylaminomethyl(34) synthesis enzyme MnmG [Gemmatimonadales bacterium]|nr:tRNA uridine-5-carboxymethylaminomethyl(34) synthesis enzyme MnmG [Gemmatimonadales bacterium]
MTRSRPSVVVVGGGHAGTEAASAAARIGAQVFLVTADLETIGQMSCNPAIGGIAKGTVVREIDAMGGIMGRAADASTIQFRMLNRSKGPAVWAPRSQCDRTIYRKSVKSLLERTPGITLVQGMVASVLTDGGRIAGIETSDGRRLPAQAVIITAGTFLRGRIHMGTTMTVDAGRAGDPPSVPLAVHLEALGLKVARFKTGTPPRVDGVTVDFAALERQDGEMPSYRFSHFSRGERPAQRSCWISWLGDEGREVIQRNLQRSALYGGAIASRGPRYCPSVEDKVVKFPAARRHQIFLEPEGLDTSELYLNGLSTSLPIGVQQEILRCIPGLEHAAMTRPGYAIEYDYYPPDQLTPWLEVKAVEGLFLAGQVNGTTGYEEAGGQGLIAGINAGMRALDQAPIVVGRQDAYVGVLVDDLVTRGVDEPYRLFTSRAEYRLLLRQDNALRRLGPLACRLGMLTDQEVTTMERRLAAEDALVGAARQTSVKPEAANVMLRSVGEREMSDACRVADLVHRPRVRLSQAAQAAGLEGEWDQDTWTSAEVELKYEGYLERERAAVRRLRELSDFQLAPDLAYLSFDSLSTEARHKLDCIRPGSLAQAGRIPGISPSDLQNLVFEVMRVRRDAGQHAALAKDV